MNFGFQEIVISVFDIHRFAEAFIEVGGYSISTLDDAPQEQYTAWQVPQDCRRIEQALLTPENDTRGCIRLVRFHGTQQHVMRSSQRSWDHGGIMDIDIYAKDARASLTALQRLGWTSLGEPLDYRMDEFHVCEILTVGPAGICVALIQPYNPPTITLPKFRGWSRAFNSSQIVQDYRRSMAFYIDALGWQPLMDIVVEDADEPGCSVLGIPKPYVRQTRQNISILHPSGTNDGSIELIAIAGPIGRDFASFCVAPNVGYLCYRVPIAKIELHSELLQSRGLALYAPLLDMVIEPYGAVRAFSVRSPDGVIIEFFEPAES